MIKSPFQLQLPTFDTQRTVQLVEKKEVIQLTGEDPTLVPKIVQVVIEYGFDY